MRIQLFVIALTLSLPACAQHGKYRILPPASADRVSPGPRFPDATILAQVEGGDDVEVRPAQPPAKAPEKTPRYPNNVLTRDLLYKFLLAEIAGQRGNVRLAARAYLELAQTTKDPRVAKRATEIAMFGRHSDIAAESASVWLDIEPDSQPAKQTLIATLLGNNKIADAKPLLQRLLAADPARTGSLFLQLPPLLSRYPDRPAAFKLVQELAKPYPQLPESHFAVAQAAFGIEDFAVSETETAEALRLKPDFEQAALLQAQLLQRGSVARATEYLKGYVTRNPSARDARLYYARLLAAGRQTVEARKEFQSLEKEIPNNPEVAVMIGLLSLQMQDYEAAESKLKRAIDLNYREPDTLRFYIGQIAEERKRDDEALAYYGQVNAGDQVVPAAVRYAMIQSRNRKFDEARAHLRKTNSQNDQQRTLLIQAEAQILREAKQYREAFEVIEAGLSEQPDNPDLMYDSAMAAEKVDKIDVLETRLKRLIELKPDNAQAYNALGYTLADRNLRLAEARQYIEKALTLAPEDGFILDSMGWVLYRQGNLDQGLDFLRRAFASRPDPEIAAHLGEVLWAKGQRKEAEDLWRQSLKDHPDNDDLKAVIRKFLK